MVRIAVLMSTYNGEKYLREQIESILNQVGDFILDLYVRDDGSSDTTCDILDEYQKKGKLKWYGGKNKKTALSFLELLYHIEGYDYYAFSDQDDVWFEKKLISGIDSLSRVKEPAFYYCNAEYVDSKLQALGGVTYKRAPSLNFYSQLMCPSYLGCTMILNSLLVDVIQKCEEAQIASMHDSFVARICVLIGGSVLFDHNVYIKYRQHEANVIGSTVGIKDAIIRRINAIRHKPQIGISKQLDYIVNNYEKYIPNDNIQKLKIIVDYNKSFLNKCKLIFSPKVRYNSLRMRLTYVLFILFESLY